MPEASKLPSGKMESHLSQIVVAPPRGCFAYSTVISVISSLLLSICLNPSSIFRIFILSDHAFSL